jgi:hypothetical protein
MPCVYALVSSAQPDHYRYIGISKYDTPNKRLSEHLHQAKNGKNSYKCNVLRKILHDGNSVVAVILKTSISWDEARQAEILYISQYRDNGHKLTNITAGGDGALGLRHSAEVRAKIGEAKRGKKRSPETCLKMSLAQRGRKLSPEVIAKMSESRRGLRRSVETCAKMSAANKGKKLSPEHCAKLSKAHLGKKFSPEHRAKLSESRRGSKRSAETRAKMSEARRRYWAARRLSGTQSASIN